MKRIFLIIIIMLMFGCASQQPTPNLIGGKPDANESLIELVNVLVEQMAEKFTFTLQVKASTYEGAQLFQVFFLRRQIADEEDVKEDTEEKAEQSALKK